MQHSIVTDLVIILTVVQIGFVVWGLWIETQLKDLKKYMKRIDVECSRTEFRSLENDLKIKVSEKMMDVFQKDIMQLRGVGEEKPLPTDAKEQYEYGGLKK